jgi:hypothetical protein
MDLNGDGINADFADHILEFDRLKLLSQTLYLVTDPLGNPILDGDGNRQELNYPLKECENK